MVKLGDVQYQPASQNDADAEVYVVPHNKTRESKLKYFFIFIFYLLSLVAVYKLGTFHSASNEELNDVSNNPLPQNNITEFLYSIEKDVSQNQKLLYELSDQHDQLKKMQKDHSQHTESRLTLLENVNQVLDTPSKDVSLTDKALISETAKLDVLFDKTVMFTYFNKGYLQLFLNLVASLKILNLNHKLHVYLTAADYEDLSSQPFFKEVSVHRHDFTMDSAMHDWGSKSFHEDMIVKMNLMHMFLKDGFDILYLDSDTAVLKDFTSYIKSKVTGPPALDVIFLHDDGPTSADHADETCTNPCGGFFWMRATDYFIDLFDMTQEAHQKLFSGMDDNNDQEYMMEFFKNNNMWPTRCFQDRDAFANGWWAFKKLNKNKIKEKTYFVHSNYVVGMAKKVDRLKHFGAWFI